MKSYLLTLLRHQVGSLIATLVDFGTMIALVAGLGVPPVRATAVGALCGATTNFILGRRWIFRAKTDDRKGQIARYAFTAVMSLSFNAAGEYALHYWLGIQYVVARAFVSVAVSLLWNFPMQRRFVFRPG